MNAPIVARMLVAAFAPAADVDAIAGDMQEEYVAIVAAEGRLRGDLWFWSQALTSIPALLSYSRRRAPFAARLTTGFVALGVLIAMLAAKDGLDRVIDAIHPASMPASLYFTLDWSVAFVFGGLLALLAGHHPVRLALFAASALVAAFAAPDVLALSPSLSLPALVLLLGVVPSMTGGAAAFQAIRHR
ncbi:MAG TPA: hypothetical protein VGN14_18880 [Candidatus Elarobacter sp.]